MATTRKAVKFTDCLHAANDLLSTINMDLHQVRYLSNGFLTMKDRHQHLSLVILQSTAD